MGGLHVDVPEGIDLRVGGLSIMGGRRVDEPARPPGPGAPVVDLRVFGIMGGTRVRVRGRRSGEIEA